MSDDAAAEAAHWERYGKALIHSMHEVLGEAPEEAHHLLLETADYWLSLGLAIGLGRAQEGHRLLELIEAEERDRSELGTDAESFLSEALG